MKKFSILIFSPEPKHVPEFNSEVKILNLKKISQPSQLYKELILQEYDLIILLKIQGNQKKRICEVIDNIQPNIKKIFLKKPMADLSGFLKSVN